jgi:hypothetical protein
MKTTNHTPGPWAIHERAKDSRTHISNGAHIICTLGTTRTDGSPNHTPNARLIAAAPDLLSALDSCLEIMIRAIGERLPIQQGTECEETDWQTAIRNAREALRKAKGAA